MSDIRRLLEKLDSMAKAEKKPTGPKFPGYWKGTDPASKARSKMVGGAEESILPELLKTAKERVVENKLLKEFTDFKTYIKEFDPLAGTSKPGDPVRFSTTLGQDGNYSAGRNPNIDDETVRKAQEYAKGNPDKLGDFISDLEKKGSSKDELGNFISDLEKNQGASAKVAKEPAAKEPVPAVATPVATKPAEPAAKEPAAKEPVPAVATPVATKPAEPVPAVATPVATKPAAQSVGSTSDSERTVPIEPVPMALDKLMSQLGLKEPPKDAGKDAAKPTAAPSTSVGSTFKRKPGVPKISPEEAQSVLDNGTPADIERHGGKDYLNQLSKQSKDFDLVAPAVVGKPAASGKLGQATGTLKKPEDDNSGAGPAGTAIPSDKKPKPVKPTDITSTVPSTVTGQATGQQLKKYEAIDLIRKDLESKGIKDRRLQAAILANAEKETGADFKSRSENLDYSGDKMYRNPATGKLETADQRTKRIFSSNLGNLPDEEVKRIRKLPPEQFAEKVYGAGTPKGKDLGNTEPGDGWNYRGRGYVQLTGRGNYTDMSNRLFGDDRLIKNPDLANDPAVASKITSQIMQDRAANMAKQLNIDIKNMTPNQANLLATSVIAGRPIKQGQGYLGGAENLGKVQKAAGQYKESKDDDFNAEFQAMVKRVGQLAKQGPMKTVWDPVKRVYKTVPVDQKKKVDEYENEQSPNVQTTSPPDPDASASSQFTARGNIIRNKTLEQAIPNAQDPNQQVTSRGNRGTANPDQQTTASRIQQDPEAKDELRDKSVARSAFGSLKSVLGPGVDTNAAASAATKMSSGQPTSGKESAAFQSLMPLVAKAAEDPSSAASLRNALERAGINLKLGKK